MKRMAERKRDGRGSLVAAYDAGRRAGRRGDKAGTVLEQALARYGWDRRTGLHAAYEDGYEDGRRAAATRG